MPSLDDARAQLTRYFAYPDFRPGQVDVVSSILDGHDTLGVLPTGGGKSLCYQVPALTMPGVTVVVSPLISLMKDQVDRLLSRGVAAAYLNSTLDATTSADILARVRAGRLTLLYVAPERLQSRDLVQTLAGTRLALLAVDEAHCISEWGHDFRPSFRRIAAVRSQLGDPQVAALTATATPRVRRDIAGQLRMRDPRVIVLGFDRTNLSFEARRCRNDVDRERQLVAALRAGGRPAIVYASTRATVNHVAKMLSARRLRVAGYHGGLRDTVRHEVQERFMAGRLDAIVATNAFGMGIDKPDVRLVAHYALPGTLEAYYQEAGRAGRDGKPGHCVLLFGDADRDTHEFFIRCTFPPRSAVHAVHRELQAQSGAGVTPTQAALVQRCRTVEPRDVEAALRLLEKHHVIEKRSRWQGELWIRMLATPERVRRELAATGAERLALRTLWRGAGDRLMDGVPFDAPTFDRRTRGALDRLRNRQFLHFDADDGYRLLMTRRPFDALPIDWNAIERRRRAEIEKLDAMEGYARTRECRRRFVLGYFGERRAPDKCGGCDNCLRAGG